jgi:hypothetical protein
LRAVRRDKDKFAIFLPFAPICSLCPMRTVDLSDQQRYRPTPVTVPPSPVVQRVMTTLLSV